MSKDSRMDAAARMYRAGVATAEIGRKLGVSQPTASRWARQRGCLPRGRGGSRPHLAKLSKILLRRSVLVMHKSGASRRAIAEATGVSQRTITRWVHAAEQTRPNGHGDLVRSVALSLYRKGVKLDEIRKVTGASSSAVLRWAKRDRMGESDAG